MKINKSPADAGLFLFHHKDTKALRKGRKSIHELHELHQEERALSQVEWVLEKK
ncbi:hypothetical protein JEZ13_11930 [bacterium]|nr:hypothetical protein [bacterium]